MVYTYFNSMKNIWGVPITYAIHNTRASSVIAIDMEQEIIQNSPLHVNMLYCDTKEVLVILKDLTVDTDS